MREHARDDDLSGWERFRRKFKEVGLAYLSQVLFQRIVPHWLLRVHSVWINRTDLQAWTPPTDEGPEIRWGTMDDLALFSAWERRPGESLVRLKSGARPAMVVRDGRIIALTWYRPRWCEVDGWLRFTSPSDSLWTVSAKVLPQYRGQRLHNHIKAFAMADWAREGYRQSFGWVEALNRNSIKATRRTGSKPIARVTTVRCLGLGVIWFDGSLKIGRWNAEQVLELSIDHLLEPIAPGPRSHDATAKGGLTCHEAFGHSVQVRCKGSDASSRK